MQVNVIYFVYSAMAAHVWMMEAKIISKIFGVLPCGDSFVHSCKLSYIIIITILF
jgi:hypothetical protein